MPPKAKGRARVTRASKKSVPAGTSTPPLAEAPAGPRYKITLRFRLDENIREESFELDDRTLYPEAKRWNYVVRNRERLSDRGRASSSDMAIERLAEIFGRGADTSKSTARLKHLLQDIARSGLVEVSLPGGQGNPTGYAARVFPWEMVLTYLTWGFRTAEQRLTVTRHLDSSRESAWPQTQLKTLLTVSSAPGKIADAFNLMGECRLVAGVLGLAPCKGAKAIIVENPAVGELKELIAGGQPDVIHLTGVDPYYVEYNKLLPERTIPADADLSAPRELEGRDGLVLFHPTKTYDPLGPERLAALCTAGGHDPHFVALSTCYSGRRVASRVVEAGAHAAIGFQDTVTDAAAEAFFSAFYRFWRAQGWAHPATVLLDAIREATTDAAINLSGGVVLWSRHSVFTAPAPARPRARVQVAAIPKAPPKLDPRRDLEIVFNTVGTLNYSLLHNRRSLFTEFRVRKQPGIFPDLTVQVALDAGGASLPCRFTCPLPEDGKPVDLLKHVSTPLLAPLLRRVSESLRSNVYLRVSCEFEGKEIVLRETTCPITILPVDEWRDDGKDHCWLPSFVLPRDPAVLKITTVALRYLRAIADDPQAGFSGYQGIDGTNSAEVVDPQVRALWAALQHEFRLAYINPPPSYTVQAQRLRTPSQILAGGAATCIDLALLFSACLEYIGIYPAIFLIQGHAFPGYWRDDESWLGLQEVLKETDDVISTDEMPALNSAPLGSSTMELGQKWMLSGVEHFPALSGYVRAQKLVPFESTFVTASRGFGEAQSQGRDNLDPRTFDAMIDVGLARLRGGVTPLPILES